MVVLRLRTGPFALGTAAQAASSRRRRRDGGGVPRLRPILGRQPRRQRAPGRPGPGAAAAPGHGTPRAAGRALRGQRGRPALHLFRSQLKDPKLATQAGAGPEADFGLHAGRRLQPRREACLTANTSIPVLRYQNYRLDSLRLDVGSDAGKLDYSPAPGPGRPGHHR
ncbi:MAG: hypothetical protein WKG07_29670 [Hymenobacter sp.]